MSRECGMQGKAKKSNPTVAEKPKGKSLLEGLRIDRNTRVAQKVMPHISFLIPE